MLCTVCLLRVRPLFGLDSDLQFPWQIRSIVIYGIGGWFLIIMTWPTKKLETLLKLFLSFLSYLVLERATVLWKGPRKSAWEATTQYLIRQVRYQIYPPSLMSTGGLGLVRDSLERIVFLRSHTPWGKRRRKRNESEVDNFFPTWIFWK